MRQSGVPRRDEPGRFGQLPACQSRQAEQQVAQNALTSGDGARASGGQVSSIQKRSESRQGTLRHPSDATISDSPAHGSEAVHLLAVADQLAAFWMACQENELPERARPMPA